MPHSKISIIYFLALLVSCSSNGNVNKEKPQTNAPLVDSSIIKKQSDFQDKEFEDAWKVFAKTVLVKDFKTIKYLSAKCIYCTDCPTNTSKEDSLFAIFRKNNPNSWYDKLYEEFSYIPIDRFLKEDFSITFEPVVESRMLDNSKTRYHIVDTINLHLFDKKCITQGSNLKNIKIIEIFVKVVDFSEETEGMSKTFIFIQTKDGYKFCGYSTIP